VWNKIDLISSPLRPVEGIPNISVSAKERKGLEDLKHAIDALIWQNGAPQKEEILITSMRHRQALVEADDALEMLITGLKDGVSPEFLSSEMRRALSALGTIIGTNITEDILSAIFSKFCVGK
jgi:tRNA modification GTPase